MANTSLAEQLKKLAAPHTSLLVQKKKKSSLLFNPSEAASIDRDTFYEIGINGLNELIEINASFQEFQNSLFDETSKSFERSVESAEVNEKLNSIIKKFLYSLSPYFLLKPSQKVLEWLIVRFYVHEYNVDELICIALPYHGTRLFARLIQVFDLKHTHERWQWLYPLQKKGVPLSKIALFNHAATDVTFVKMICEVTVDAAEIFGSSAFKLSTLFGFYSTTLVGTIKHMSEITELHLTYILPSILHGLTSDCADYTASSFIIIGALLTKASFEARIHKKLVEKVTKVQHLSLRNSVILLLNVMYQSERLEDVNVSTKTITNISYNSEWFIPAISSFTSKGLFPNIFYLSLIRDSLRLLLKDSDAVGGKLLTFVRDLLQANRVDDNCAEELIKIIINEAKENDEQWSRELIQGLERQYPIAWDNVISILFKDNPSESLSKILGLTSITSQVEIFEKLNHPNSVVRIEAVEFIAKNPEMIKAKYIENNLIARWQDEEPKVVESMFLLPKNLQCCSPEIIHKVLFKCWSNTGDEWNSLLTKVIQLMKEEYDLSANGTKYTVFLLPFLVLSSRGIQNAILEIELPFFRAMRDHRSPKLIETIYKAIGTKSALPTVDELIEAYQEMPKEKVYLLTFLLLFSGTYALDENSERTRILQFVSEEILPTSFKRFRLKSCKQWNDSYLVGYYSKTKNNKLPKEIIHKFHTSSIEHTPFPEQLSRSWWDFLNEENKLVAVLYKYLNVDNLGEDIEKDALVAVFMEKHFKTLPSKIIFLCNVSLMHKEEPCLQVRSFQIMNFLLKSSSENYSWTLDLKLDNIVVPFILIFLYSPNPELRALAIETVQLISMTGSVLTSGVTYVELMKFLLQYKEEIQLDRDQLPSVLYSFLSQEHHVQSLLPPSTRYFTKKIHDTLIESITNETIPLPVAASLIVVLEYLKDRKVIAKLITLANRIAKSSNYPDEHGSFVILNTVDKFHANDMEMYQLPEIRHFIEYCLLKCSELKVRTPSGVCCIGTIILRKFSIDIFDKLKANFKKFIFDVMLKICSECDNIDLISAANSFAKKITIDCQLIKPYLENMKSVSTSEKAGKKKPVNILKTTEWKRGIALLELIQNKKKMNNCRLIIPLLFEILQKCCEVDDEMSMEYAKQVCLSCALNCSQKLVSEDEADSLEKLFNVELVVNCIRMSPNPQTHHHALLLLAYCATFAPNRVLNNIMAIFTFMGSSVLRQDDAFSFQIISNILETIVPLLVRRQNESSKMSSKSIISVLRVFASSVPDIPDHRRTPILLKLMKILQDGSYLDALLVLSVECCSKQYLNDKAVSGKYADVMQELCLSQPVSVTIECFRKLMGFINLLPHSVDEKKVDKSVTEFVELKKYSSKEYCHFRYLLLNFISTTLSCTKFINQVTQMSDKDIEHQEDSFKGIIESTLLYIKSATEYSSSLKNASTKYWKVVISQALEILNKINALLTKETFLSVIEDLLNHECLTVQRKVMEMLNWKLQQAKEEADSLPAKELFKIIAPIVNIVDTISETDEEVSFDLKLNQQLALISLKLLTRHCSAKNHVNKFKKILSKLLAVLQANANMNEHVLASMILCVAELISSLRVHAIEYLPKFMPTFLKLFKKYQNEQGIAQNDVTLLSIITALQKVVEVLPNFLSPYMESIIFEVCCLAEKMRAQEKNTEDTIKQSNMSYKLKLIRQKISSEIPSRVLLPSVSACFARLCETRNFNAIKYLMEILADSFPNNGQFSTELTSLFLIVLDFRCTADEHQADEMKTQVEDYVIETLCKIILKCSEAAFRPFYHKFYEWGVIVSKEVSLRDRIITYYRVLKAISEKLKSIFVSFAANFIRNSAELLDKNNISKCEGSMDNMYFSSNTSKSILLVDAIMNTLYNVFKYDTVKFLTKERFHTLVEPLVNQIENTIGNYEERSSSVIIPCLAHFAAATSDDSLWKQFNYLILLKTRHSSPEIRLTALETVCMFATQLTDNFLPFLPETVPFLAELLEDENEEVEKRTHKAVQRLEHILDEPIQKYF